ncbi:hypothetical protein [Actinomadura rudentiformis]|uniref:Uncharacterized protein n=1 Tax=Actinomadura rudentiformis TaxID=359158 RepID=A0A6H9YNF9_9ACTN|nr:hypothetical protein [Actinomadura rudentiformis]KAB2348514.1 hypothetical protein F8566_17185 [Actinomadura rudentiformis]
MERSPWIVSTPFAKEHYGRGIEEGCEVAAEALLALLDIRGLQVSAAERERITSCRDVDQLRKWIEQAKTTVETADLFC